MSGSNKIQTLGHGKKKAVSQALPPQNLLQPLFSSFFFLIRSKVTKYMPIARKNMKISTFIALLHLLCGHNVLNYSISVGCCHLYVLRSANGQPVHYSVTISTLGFQLRTLTLSVLAFVVF